MRSLFIRLFLSFILIMVLTTIFSSVLFSTFRKIAIENLKEDMNSGFERKIATMLLISGKAAYEIYLHNSLEAYNQHMLEMKNSHSDFFIIDPQTFHTLSGRPIPPELLELVQTSKNQKSLEVKREKRHLYMADYYLTNGGRPAAIIAGIHTMRLPPGLKKDTRAVLKMLPLFKDHGQVINSIIFLIAACLVCFFLARSLTSPLRKLRRATQKIADGDLSTRTRTDNIRDIREIHELSHDFDIMAEKVENLINSQKRLLRDISHELRSPLTRLNLSLELLKKGAGNEQRHMARIEQESERLENMIGQLLNIARFENGNTNLKKVQIDLIPLLENLINDVMFEIEQSKEINFNYDYSLLKSSIVFGNYDLIRSALENILRNSIKYTADFSRIQIDMVSAEDDSVCIRVEDSGPGIPDAQLTEVLQPFYRVDDSRNRKTGGTGIGLTIAHQSIKLNNGKLLIANKKEGQGLVVQVHFPLCKSTDN